MLDLNHLDKYRENNRIEAKTALGGFPESFWETYSAFANTLGGLILLGVEELPDKTLHPVNLEDPQKYIDHYRKVARNPEKVSADILWDEHISVEECEGCKILVFKVPRALRAFRPVYIGTDPKSGTYIRNGEGDFRCPPEEVERMLRESSLLRCKKGILDYLTENLSAGDCELSEALALPLDLVQRALRELCVEDYVKEFARDSLPCFKLKR